MSCHQDEHPGVSNMATNTNLLRLPGFPSCQDSIAWGSEHVAVAAGENIHILTKSTFPPSESSLPLSWHTETVRVNRFSEHEWPHQELAALHELSIGEEQSDSKVVSLAWSPRGLGLHNRAVLAVLTSNLVLSLWESNGKAGTWRRALVVNPHVLKVSNDNRAIDIDKEDAVSPGSKRRSQRIRAFTWLPLLTLANADDDAPPKRGVYLLAVVDDNYVVSYLQFCRGAAPHESFTINTIYQHQVSNQLSGPVPSSGDFETNNSGVGVSPLQALLAKESRVSRIVAGLWDWDRDRDQAKDHDESSKWFSIPLTLVRGPDGSPLQKDTFIVRARSTETGVVIEHHAFTSAAESGPDLGGRSLGAIAANRVEQAIDASVQDFNQQHHLQGCVRVRHWGSATDPTGTYAAASIITLHPSNMLELVDVSKDNILLVLLAGAENSLQASIRPHADQPDQPVQKILSWIKAHATDENVKSELDIRLLRMVAAVVAIVFGQDTELSVWAKSIVLPILYQTGAQDGNDGPIQTSSSAGPFSSLYAESCEWCGANILLADNTDNKLARARCSNSHVFNRCGLTFLSIQEPGVSKHCVGCGKEFLDMAKLSLNLKPSLTPKPGAGPSSSLALDLFEVFDICPYCQGTFSG